MSKRKILFVDDDPNIIKSLKRLFRDEGYEPYTAADGHEAMKLLDQHEFALILSDFRIPELNGIEFLKLAKEKAHNTIRMILTGYADVEVAAAAINEGEVYKFIEKPWDDENLKVQVRRAVEHYELMVEKEALTATIREQNEELIKSNTELERRVEEKTAELRKAYRELELKLKELESRDRINQYLLTINPLDETLDVILQELTGIKSFDRIVIYVADMEKKLLLPRIGYKKHGKEYKSIAPDKSDLPDLPVPKLSSGREYGAITESMIQSINDFIYFLPIVKDKICLGGVFMDNSISKARYMEQDFKMIAGFGSLAALAINEYFIASSLPDMENEIEARLRELKQS